MDELVVRVSQELRAKELDARDRDYQAAAEKEGLQKQVEMLRRELQEEKERKARLELLEGDLIHRADAREQESEGLKRRLRDAEERLEVKTDAIEKAQKVIERLGAELDKLSNALANAENERDQARHELRESSKRIIELNKQVASLQVQN